MSSADEGRAGGSGSQPLKRRRTWYSAALLGFCLAAVVGLVLRTFVVSAVRVHSRSMEETILPGDHVLVNRLVVPRRLLLQIPFAGWSPRVVEIPPIRPIRLGDVLVIHPPAGLTRELYPATAFLLKRCVGTPGDTLVFRGSTLAVNGRVVSFPPTAVQSRTPTPFTEFHAPVILVVPPETYFMMGDNPANSEDSRVWGPVSYRSIVGSAAVVYWSVTPGSRTGLSGSSSSSVRWDRLGVFIR
jgi:signal peptidase I